MELFTTIFGLLFFIAAVVVAFLVYHSDMAKAPVALWIIAFLMEPAGALFGFVSATVLGLSRKDCRTIGIETGVQSFTLTLAIIALSFSGEDRDKAIIFPILYGVMYLANSVWIVLSLRFLVAPHDEDEENKEEEGADWPGSAKTEIAERKKQQLQIHESGDNDPASTTDSSSKQTQAVDGGARCEDESTGVELVEAQVGEDVV